VGADQMRAALSSLGPGFTVTDASSAAVFQSDISSGSYDIGIFLVDSGASSSYSAAINALGTFVASGGRGIYSDMSGNSSLAAQFKVSFRSDTNFSAMDVPTPLSAYLSTPTNIGLINPGYSVYSIGQTGLSGSVELAYNPLNALDATITGGNLESGAYHSVVNGFANGTVAGSQGVQLYVNEIEFLAGQPLTQVPLPAALPLLVSGLLSFLGIGARYRRAAA